MSGEKYQRPEGFPKWVDSIEDEELVGEAEGYCASDRVLNSKASCAKFVSTKRNLSGPQAGVGIGSGATSHLLNTYLFEESTLDVLNRSQRYHFSHSTLGTVELPRKTLIQAITRSLTQQQERNDLGPYNIYLYGMKGSGKTVLLAHLAKQLQSEHYIVYFLPTAEVLRNLSGIKSQLPKDESVKVAILVDEVNSNLTDGWYDLLRSSRKNMVTIAAGVVQYQASATTAEFRDSINVNLILPNNDKSQLQELINYWENVTTDNTVATADICEFLCEYCGGHFFATAKFSEYAFSDPACAEYNKNLVNFQSHFNTQAFRNSDAFQTVRQRCLFLQKDIVEALEHAFLGTANNMEIERLEKKGRTDEGCSEPFLSILNIKSLLKP